jgi:glycosyltransferase involved in cell wall biosynthesis
LYNPGLVGRVMKRVNKIKPDVVHAWVVHLNLSLGLLARLDNQGLPVVLTAQDTGIFCPTKYICKPPSNPGQAASAFDCLKCRRFRYLPGRGRLGVSLVNSHVREVTAASDALASILRANGMRNVSVNRAGLDPAGVEQNGWTGAEFRQEFNLGENPYILFGARLQENKGDEAAIRAFARLSGFDGVKLVVAGASGPDLDRLTALADGLGVLDKVVFLGWLTMDQLLGAYRGARMVLVPSLYPDPLPTMNLLAMALSKPVVGTPYGGTPEAVADGQTGFIVDPLDADLMAERMSALLKDENLAETMGRAGRARLDKEFTVARQVDQFEELYGRVR